MDIKILHFISTLADAKYDTIRYTNTESDFISLTRDLDKLWIVSYVFSKGDGKYDKYNKYNSLEDALIVFIKYLNFRGYVFDGYDRIFIKKKQVKKTKYIDISDEQLQEYKESNNIKEGVKIKLNYFNKPCVYCLWDKDERVYIGQTVNLLGRIYQHKNKDFDSFSVICYEDDERERKIKEGLFAFHYKPRLNKMTPFVNVLSEVKAKINGNFQALETSE